MITHKELSNPDFDYEDRVLYSIILKGIEERLFRFWTQGSRIFCGIYSVKNKKVLEKLAKVCKTNGWKLDYNVRLVTNPYEYTTSNLDGSSSSIVYPSNVFSYKVHVSALVE